MRWRRADPRGLNLDNLYTGYWKPWFGRDENDFVVRLRRKCESQIQELTWKMLMNEQQAQDSNPGGRRSRGGVCLLTVNGAFFFCVKQK